MLLQLVPRLSLTVLLLWQALAMRKSGFAHFHLSPEDVHQWRLEQQRLEAFAADSRRLCSSAAAPLAGTIGPSIGGSRGSESVPWHRKASAESHGQRVEPEAAGWPANGAELATALELATQLAVQQGHENGTPVPDGNRSCRGATHCAAASRNDNCTGAHQLAAFAGHAGGHQPMSQASLLAACIPIESAANDLALQVANLRNPQRLRAIRHCLEDSHIGPILTSALQGVVALGPPAPDHGHVEQGRPTHRRHNHRAEQKKVLRDWFDQHALDPYPSNDEKVELAKRARMDVKQVENWFTNRRKRNWRHVREEDEPAAPPQAARQHEPTSHGMIHGGTGGANSGAVAIPPMVNDQASAAEPKRLRVAGA